MCDDQEMMSVPEAARFLGVGERTLRRWMADERIPHAKVGGLVRFRRQSLLDWLEAQERETMGGEGPCRLPDLLSGG